MNRKFSPDQPCEAVHYQKHTAAFHCPELEYWMVMVKKEIVLKFFKKKKSYESFD
jgi:hypothetical protein